MHPLSIACLVMAALAAYTGLFHLALFAGRGARQYLPFALLCLCVSAYDIACVGLYSSHSVAEGIVWQRLQIPSIILIAGCILWFVRTITEQRRNRALYLVLFWLAVLLAAVLVCPERYILSESNPLIKDIHWGGSLWITYYEAEAGPVFTVVLVSVLAVYLYLFYLLARRYRETRSRSHALIMASQVLYFLGIVSDVLVVWDVYTFIYVSEYTFLVIVLAMAYALMREFMDLDDAVRESNRNLTQKVEERTLEIRRLNDELRRLAELTV